MMIPLLASSLLSAVTIYGGAQVPDYVSTQIGINRGTMSELNPLGQSVRSRIAMSIIGPAVLTAGDQIIGKHSKKTQKWMRVGYVAFKVIVVYRNSRIAFGKR